MSRYDGPPQEQYIKPSVKAYFTYLSGEKTFQQGYLGVGQSFVCGCFHIRYPVFSPLFARSIRLSLEGFEETQWDDEGEVSRKNICSVFTELWGSQSEYYEDITSLDLPFSIPIPNNALPSVELPKFKAKIYYILNATIYRAPNIFKLQFGNKEVQVRCQIKRYAFPPRLDLKRWLVWEDPNTVRKGVGYDVSLPYSSYCPLSQITLLVKLLFHNPRVYLKSISLGIKEYREVHVGGKQQKVKKYVGRTKLSGDQVPMSLAANESRNICQTEVKLTVPGEDMIYYSLSSSRFTISHKVKVKIAFGRALDVKLDKEIKIERLLSEELAARATAEGDGVGVFAEQEILYPNQFQTISQQPILILPTHTRAASTYLTQTPPALPQRRQSSQSASYVESHPLPPLPSASPPEEFLPPYTLNDTT